MSNRKIIKYPPEAMIMLIQRDLIPATGVYEAVNSNQSSMNEPSAKVIDYMY